METTWRVSPKPREATPSYMDAPIPVGPDPRSYPEVVQPGLQRVPSTGGYPNHSPWGPAKHDEYNAYGPNNQQLPPQKAGRSTKFWVIITACVATVIVVVLSGVLGAIASGMIKMQNNTAVGASPNNANTSTQSSSSGSPAAAYTPPTSTTGSSGPTKPSPNQVLPTTTISTSAGVVKVECPAADGLNYTATTVSPGTLRVFRRQCDVNYQDGDFGPANTTILSMADCLEACANFKNCIGAVFNVLPLPDNPQQCWFKQWIGVKSSYPGVETAILYQ